MKNVLIISVISIVVGIIGLSMFTLFQNTSTSGSTIQKNVQDTMEKKEDDEMEKKSDDTMTVGSRYVEYSKSALENAAGNRRVLFFYASWCSTCRPADANFKENMSQIPQDVTLFRVNYNDPETDQEEKDLAKNYDITYQHTFVQIDGQDKALTKWNGGQINELLLHIK